LLIKCTVNNKFGQDYVRNYDDVCVGVVNLVRETRDGSLLCARF